MKRLIMIGALIFLTSSLILSLPAFARKRTSKPWTDVSLSTLPSVVGMTNSWSFEINYRSPAYLSDVDKMYLQAAYGTGSNKYSPPKLDGKPAGRYGYYFYRGINYAINDARLDIYSNFSKSTFGSCFITYGTDHRSKDDQPFLAGVPSRLSFKTAFAWKLKENLTAAVSGSINNYPLSYVFNLQPRPYGAPADTQFTLTSGDGENIVGEADLMYRTQNNLDVIIGGIFQTFHSKFDPPDPPHKPDGTPANYYDTATVKEYIYSAAPKISVKKTFSTGSYLRAGGSYYFNLFDYQYLGRNQWEYPSLKSASYRLQSFDTFVPKWKLYADGAKALGASSVLYSCLEVGSYPNALSLTETAFVPMQFSLVNRTNLFSGSLSADITSRLTRIFTASCGIELRYFNNGDVKTQLDERTIYAKLRMGATTRFYRNLWWSVRIPGLRLYSSNELGSAVLFENKSYIEFDILFLGL